MKTVFLLGAVLAGIYSLYAIAMIALHPRFIYPFYDNAFKGVGYARTAINDTAQAYVYRGAEDAPVIVYFMGNAGALDLFLPMLDHHKARGRGIVALGYRGGGGLPGHPSERTLKADALDLMSYVSDSFPDRKVILHGYSLGTGIALHAAARMPVDGVVLAAPYDTMCRLMARASYLPACVLPVQGWKSAKDAPSVKVPVLALHGSTDALIPISEGKRLVSRLPNGRLVPVEGAGHTDLLDFPSYKKELDIFIGELAAR